MIAQRLVGCLERVTRLVRRMRAIPHRLISCLLILPVGLIAAGGQGWHLFFPHDGECRHEGILTAPCHPGHDPAAMACHHGCTAHREAHHACSADSARRAPHRSQSVSVAAGRHGQCHHCSICDLLAKPVHVTGHLLLVSDTRVCGDVPGYFPDVPAGVPQLGYDSRGPPVRTILDA